MEALNFSYNPGFLREIIIFLMWKIKFKISTLLYPFCLPADENEKTMARAWEYVLKSTYWGWQNKRKEATEIYGTLYLQTSSGPFNCWLHLCEIEKKSSILFKPLYFPLCQHHPNYIIQNSSFNHGFTFLFQLPAVNRGPAAYGQV